MEGAFHLLILASTIGRRTEGPMPVCRNDVHASQNRGGYG